MKVAMTTKMKMAGDSLAAAHRRPCPVPRQRGCQGEACSAQGSGHRFWDFPDALREGKICTRGLREPGGPSRRWVKHTHSYHLKVKLRVSGEGGEEHLGGQCSNSPIKTRPRPQHGLRYLLSLETVPSGVPLHPNLLLKHPLNYTLYPL